MTDLRKMIDEFLAASGMAPSEFGKTVMRNPNFVFDIRKGNGFTAKTYKKVSEYVAANTPAADDPASKTADASQ